MRNALSYLALLPVIATQGIYTASRAPQLPEAAGPRRGACGRGTPLRVLIVGDSSAAGVGVSHQNEALSGTLSAALAQNRRVHWKLIARSGATTATTLEMLDDEPADKFDLALIALGVNDAKNGVPLRTWRRNYTQLMDLLQHRFEVSRIYASGLPPVGDFPILPQPLRSMLAQRAALFDQHLDEMLHAHPVGRHLPVTMRLTPELMAVDGFHPGPEVYAEWGRQAQMAIEEDLSTILPDPTDRPH